MYFSWHGTGIRQKAMTKKHSMNTKTSQDTECTNPQFQICILKTTQNGNKTTIMNFHFCRVPDSCSHVTIKDVFHLCQIGVEWGRSGCDLLRKLAVFVVTAFWCLVLCGSVKARPWTFASPPTIIFQGKSEMRIFFKSNFQKKTCASWWLYVWMLYSHWLTFNDSSSPSFQTTPENSWISSCPFVSTSWTRDRSGVVAFNAVPPFCNQGHSSWPLQTCSR